MQLSFSNRYVVVLVLFLLCSSVGWLPASAHDGARAGATHPRVSSVVQQAATELRQGHGRLQSDSVLQPGMLRLSDTGEIGVEVRVHGPTAEAAAAFADLGVRVAAWSDQFPRVGAWVQPDQLEALAALPMVVYVDPMLAPLMRTGAITSQGDAVLQADDVRSLFGLSGAGVRVGVISDGLDGIVAAQNSGELPPDCPVPDPAASCVQVDAANAGSGSEGVAMLEIIHDLAPGAVLGFASGTSGVTGFVAAIDYLQDSFQADVIVDDIGYLTEPYFEDGDIAIRAQQAVDAGVVYVSAAGNDADRHYQAPLMIPAGCPRNTELQCLHTFAPQDTSQSLTLANGASVSVILQWDNPFGDSVDDLDIYILEEEEGTNNGSTILARSIADQLLTRQPIEIVSYTNRSGAEQDVGIVVDAYALRSGTIPEIEMLFIGANQPQHLVSADSVYGHPAMPGVLAVGAVPSVSPGTIEPYSSRGPATIQHPVPESRPKPDLVGPDCVSTSTPGFRIFCGTSAAAPHIAALAALLLEQEPRARPAQVRALLQDNAVDLGPVGFDTTYGAGLADALTTITSSRYGTAIHEITLPLVIR